MTYVSSSSQIHCPQHSVRVSLSDLAHSPQRRACVLDADVCRPPRFLLLARLALRFLLPVTETSHRVEGQCHQFRKHHSPNGTSLCAQLLLIWFSDQSVTGTFFPDNSSTRLQGLARQVQTLVLCHLAPSVLYSFLILHVAIRIHKVSAGLLTPRPPRFRI